MGAQELAVTQGSMRTVFITMSPLLHKNVGDLRPFLDDTNGTFSFYFVGHVC